MDFTYYIFIIFISVIATVAMTSFSYLLEIKKDKKFHEPELINNLIKHNTSLNFTISKKNVIGWIIHFLIGVAFTGIFLFLYSFKLIELDLLSALIFGCCAGIVGIIGWSLMFGINENPPKIHLKDFYIQLILAHIIFTLFVMLGFYLLESNFESFSTIRD